MFSSIRSLLGVNRRRASRVPRDELAHLFAGVAPLGPVRIVDRSETGARVELTARFDPSSATRLLVLASSQLVEAEVAWFRAPELGLRLGASRHLRGYTEGELDQIKAWWTTHRIAMDS